eukprot:TRINITY_DN3630_c0_g1_i3.p1 TRINITY_DN3630_c0_g1~~TRINITY_DN3630_c0_g1_i3.p1  ORF type:complete len:129 (-),score=35.16 TRINITY_DN3630_c0_g1_i3:35-421(-)
MNFSNDLLNSNPILRNYTSKHKFFITLCINFQKINRCWFSSRSGQSPAVLLLLLLDVVVVLMKGSNLDHSCAQLELVLVVAAVGAVVDVVVAAVVVAAVVAVAVVAVGAVVAVVAVAANYSCHRRCHC